MSKPESLPPWVRILLALAAVTGTPERADEQGEETAAPSRHNHPSRSVCTLDCPEYPRLQAEKAAAAAAEPETGRGKDDPLSDPVVAQAHAFLAGVDAYRADSSVKDAFVDWYTAPTSEDEVARAVDLADYFRARSPLPADRRARLAGTIAGALDTALAGITFNRAEVGRYVADRILSMDEPW